MEVKPGYKETEVGVIPEEWDVKPLGEIGGVRMCKRVLKHQTREHGDVPFYKIGTFGGVPDAFIPQALFDEFRRKYSFPKKGDILISAAGTIGRTVLYDGAPAYFQDSNIVWIDNDESKVSNAYLWHRYQVTKWSASHGGTVARLYNDNLRTKIHVAIPTETEQRAIATALSDVDGLLGGLDRLIAKKRDLKQAAMQQLLTGQTRLPGFHGEWRDTTLGTIITRFSTGLNPRQNFQLNAGGILFYVTIKNFSEGRLYLDEQCDLIDENAFHVINRRADLRRDDILFASIGRVGDAYLITETPTNWNINESVFTLRPDKEQVVPIMLFYLLTNKPVKDALGQGVTGSTFKSIKQADLKDIPCRLPVSKDEQSAIAEVLTEMDAELAALEQRREKTRALKQAMMQELLTGKTRLVPTGEAHA